MEIGRADRVAVRALDEGRPPGAGVVARPLALYLDHVRAEVGQDLPGPGAGENPRQFEYTHTTQRAGHFIAPSQIV